MMITASQFLRHCRKLFVMPRVEFSLIKQEYVRFFLIKVLVFMCYFGYQ